ncbi:hypothetical protein [Thermomonas sp.]|uniref:hypothetical protein n=1 Tax=Thermomonas sp. TaxID=1971895 RepID=UPI0031F2DEDA
MEIGQQPKHRLALFCIVRAIKAVVWQIEGLAVWRHVITREGGARSAVHVSNGNLEAELVGFHPSLPTHPCQRVTELEERRIRQRLHLVGRHQVESILGLEEIAIHIRASTVRNFDQRRVVAARRINGTNHHERTGILDQAMRIDRCETNIGDITRRSAARIDA